MHSVLPAPRAGHTASARELPAALLRLADADADALADRLHDDLLQALIVARYAADAAVRGGDAALARDAVQDALVTLRRTVWQLRPRTRPGLVAALDALSLQRVGAGLPALELFLDGAVAAELDPTAASAAYRLVQAVVATAEHRAVEVRLTRSGRRVAVDLDRGVPDPAGWSLRARAVGGQLVVGTERVRLLLPLTASGTDPDDPERDLPHRVSTERVATKRVSTERVSTEPALTERDLSDLDREAAS